MKMVPSGTAFHVVLLLPLLLAAVAPTASDDVVRVVAPAASKEMVAVAPTAFDEGKEKGDGWSKLGSNDVFNAVSSQYDKLGTRMRVRIESIKPGTVEKHPLLKSQAGSNKPPPWWLFQGLEGMDLDATELAFRADNLYLQGFFSKKANTWFNFKPSKKNDYVIPNSKILPFENSYEALVGRPLEKGGRLGPAWQNLVGLDLSRKSIQNAISVLANYIPRTTPIGDIKLALAKIIMFTVEAQRFPYLFQLVSRAFNNDTGEDDIICIDHRGAQLVVQWERISCAILIWNMDNKRWDSMEATELAVESPNGPGIADVEDALANIWPILKPKQCSVRYTIP